MNFEIFLCLQTQILEVDPGYEGKDYTGKRSAYQTTDDTAREETII